MNSVQNIDDLIAFARAWRDLGDAVQDQVECVLFEGADEDDVNINAIRLAARELRQFPEVAGELRHWLDLCERD